MDGQQFIGIIREFVRDAAIDDTYESLKNPAGRAASLVADRTAWVRSLDEDGQRHLKSAIANAVHAALFGFLAVLDGVRIVEDLPDRGTFALYYQSSRGKTLLNDPKDNQLIDFYNDEREIPR